MPSATAQREVTLYTRAGCSLCEYAKQAIAQARRVIPFAYREVDIGFDGELFEEHRYDIPVVQVDGRTAFRHRVAADALIERLSR